MADAQDYKVKDISLADWGRKEIAMAEDEMPGLMALREEFGDQQAAEGRAHRRLPAHDHPDRGADRDPAGARRHRALVVVQHLLHPGPCRRRHRRRRHAGVRLEGHERGRILVVHRADHARAGRLDAEHDPRRRRRPDPADAPEVPGDAGRRARHLARRPRPACTACAKWRKTASC